MPMGVQYFCQALYTLDLLAKTTLNVPSDSFDFNRLENSWQDLKMAVWQ
jgi:hypothetical protein